MRQFEFSHEIIMSNILATVDRANEIGGRAYPTFPDKPSNRFRRHTEGPKDETIQKPCWENYWEALKWSHGVCWYNIRNCLYARDDYLLLYKRMVYLLYNADPPAPMLEQCEHMWFLHLHRTIVQMAQNCWQWTQRGENTKLTLRKTHFYQLNRYWKPMRRSNKGLQVPCRMTYIKTCIS